MIVDASYGTHVVAGGIALVVAPLALAARKGGRWHRRWGLAFAWSMAAVCATAIVLALAGRNYLMVLLAVFSFHLTGAGWRALYLKKLHRGQRATWVDRLLHGTAGMFNFCLLLWGLGGLLLRHEHDRLYPIFTVFGAIGTLLVLHHARKFFKRRHERHEWFFDHFTGMIAGYIATVSAFSAVNIAPRLPESMAAVAWLWPTVVGAPIIWLLVRHYKRRYANQRTPHDDFKVKIG